MQVTQASKAGMFGGVLTVVLVNITSGEILKTITLAAIGATVSFMVSIALRWMIRQLKRRR